VRCDLIMLCPLAPSYDFLLFRSSRSQQKQCLLLLCRRDHHQPALEPRPLLFATPLNTRCPLATALPPPMPVRLHIQLVMWLIQLPMSALSPKY
jgi:hypothetical protein